MTVDGARRRRARSVAVSVFGVVVCVAAWAGASSAEPSEPLRLNQFQALGSHNSYHVEQSPETLDFYLTIDPTA